MEIFLAQGKNQLGGQSSFGEYHTFNSGVMLVTLFVEV